MATGVFESIVDGVSGILPRGPISCMVVGVCSTGIPGNGYQVGTRTDLVKTLGHGPLVERLQDILQASRGNDIAIVAVPVAGNPATYISSAILKGTGPDAQTSGTSPTVNADVVVRISVGGDLGTAQIQISKDGGKTFSASTTTPGDGIVSIASIGATITLQDGLVTGDEYSFFTRLSIGTVSQSGTGPSITPSGIVTAAAQVRVKITTGGGFNEGSFQVSLDGGNTYSLDKAIPPNSDKTYSIDEIGVNLTFSDGTFVVGETYSFEVLAPVPSIISVMSAIENPLQLYDVGVIYVTGPSNSTDWIAMGVKAEELFADHRPTFFLGESRLPGTGENYQAWADDLVADSQGFPSNRFVSICCAHGKASSAGGKMTFRNWAGLLVGRLITEKTNRHIGRVKSGPIEGAILPTNFLNVQPALEDAKYVTSVLFHGLNGCFWGDDKTLANDSSDYQNIRTVRTVFKGLRLARACALKYVRDEAEDPSLTGSSSLNALKADIDLTVGNAMAGPGSSNELAGFFSTIPEGQTISNGVDVELNFVGLPVIDSIRLYAKYSIAGTANDVRLTEQGSQ